MARVMSSGGKLDLDALVVVEGWQGVETMEEFEDLHLTALYAVVAQEKEAAVRFLLEPGRTRASRAAPATHRSWRRRPRATSRS